MKKLWAFLTKDIPFLPYYQTSMFKFFLGKNFCGNHLVLLLLTPTFCIAFQLQAKAAVDCPIALDRVFLKKANNNQLELNISTGGSLTVDSSNLQNGYSFRILDPNARIEQTNLGSQDQDKCKYQVELTQALKEKFPRLLSGNKQATYFWISKKNLLDFPKYSLVEDSLQKLLLFQIIQTVIIIGGLVLAIVFVVANEKQRRVIRDEKKKSDQTLRELSDIIRDEKKKSDQTLQDLPDKINTFSTKLNRFGNDISIIHYSIQDLSALVKEEFLKIVKISKKGTDKNEEIIPVKPIESQLSLFPSTSQELNQQELNQQELNQQELNQQELNQQELNQQELNQQELNQQAEWTELVEQFNSRNTNYFENSKHRFLSLTKASVESSVGRNMRRTLQFEISPDNSSPAFLQVELDNNQWLIPNILSSSFERSFNNLVTTDYLRKNAGIFTVLNTNSLIKSQLVRPAKLIEIMTGVWQVAEPGEFRQ